jgi:succinoglycan biosynthesis protein ExoM
MDNVKIDICIVTYRRPKLLEALLQSLAIMDMAGFQVRLIIIDNDHTGSAEKTVEKYKLAKMPFIIIYDIEPIQGISYVRNRALQYIEAHYAAFLDDDETVSAGWLQSIWDALQNYKADVVFGPVIGQLPKNAPKWALKHPSFNRPRHITGTIMNLGGTGNVFFQTSVLGQPFQQFNPVYALTGGEDSDYFNRLYRSGAKMIWCDESEVFESVPAERVNIKWVCRRGYRSGQQFYQQVVQFYTVPKKFLWCLIKIVQIIVASLLLPIVILVSSSQSVVILTRIISSIGQLTIAIGINPYEEYSADLYRSESK